MVVGSSVSREACDKVFLDIHNVDFLISVHGVIEALLRRRRELYRQHRERETPEEREVEEENVIGVGELFSAQNNTNPFYSGEEQLTALTPK